MEPRALDRKWGGKRGAIAAFVVLAMTAQSWAVSLRDIRTEIKEREGITRCVIELSGETKFFQRDYLADKKYFLVDIYNIGPAAERFITPAAGPVRQILVLNRKDPDTGVLTLVFYLTDVRRYRVFSVKDPFRIVVDVLHSTEGLQPAEPKPQPEVIPVVAPGPGRTVAPAPIAPRPSQATPAVTPPALRPPGERYRKAGKKIVILDPGHGGSDSGAESYVKVGNAKVKEKDINLMVALEMKRLIDASPNMEAFLTRQNDRFLSLADRGFFCDNYCGDLFISVHCNAADSYRARGARGMEFYYLNPTGTSKGATRYLEEIENRNGGRNEANGHSRPILQALARESLLKWLTEGRIVCEHLKLSCAQIPYFQRYTNREVSVQSAFFRVLFQADMPAVLVEVGFLTNAQEVQQLVDPKFQKQIATALYNGIVSYFKARDERFEPKYLTLQTSP
jgi:N-acetylmuramoyl-L-alanine amidase